MTTRPFPAYTGADPYIFVSYAHADSDVVYPLLVALNERGVRIWYDEGIEPGSKWREELATAIEHAERVLFIASKKSAASPNCERELDYALSHNIPVQVCYIEEAALSSALSFSLGSHQAIVAKHHEPEEFQRKVYDAITGKSVERRLGAIATRRHRSRNIAIALSLVLAPLVVFFAMRSPSTDESFGPSIEIIPSLEEPVRIAVRPLRNATNDESSDWIGDGLANLLRDQLSASRYAVVLSPITWIKIEEQVETDAELVEIARRNGVDYLVAGDIVNASDKLLATVRVTNLRAGIDVLTRTYSDLDAEALIQASSQIAINAKQAMKIPREDELQTLAADFYTENIAAYEAFVNGLEHYNRFEYEEAAEFMNAAISISPDFHFARYRLAEILNVMSRRSEAAEQLAQIPVSAEISERERFYIDGLRFVFEGNFENAISTYKEMLETYPYDIEAQRRLSRTYFLTYQVDNGIDVLQRLLVQEPENPQVLGALGYQLISVGKLDDARSVLENYLQLYPNVHNAWELNGSLDLRSGDLASAAADYEKALSIDPEFTPALMGLAKTNALSGNFNKAVAGFTTIRDNDALPPRYRIDAAFDLAYVYRAMATPVEIDNALDPVRELIENETIRFGLYWYVLAQAQRDLGDIIKARAYLTNAFRDAPTGGVPTRYLHLRGLLNLDEGENADTEIAGLIDFKLPEDNPDQTEQKAIHQLRGLMLINEGQARDAVDELEKAVSLGGYEYGIYEIEMAKALFASGKRGDAIKLLEGARKFSSSLHSGEVRLDLLWHRRRASLLQAHFLNEMGRTSVAQDILSNIPNLSIEQ